jgi:TRAP-type transport system periplasmic protein
MNKTTAHHSGGLSRRHAFGLMVSAAIMVGSVPAVAQETVTLKTVTPFEPQSPLSKPIHIFKEVVERESGGKIKVAILGGTEVVPSLQQFDALRNGVIDVAMAAVPYYAGTVPETYALLYTNQAGQQMRATGLFEFMRKVHRDKANVYYLASGGGQPGTAFRFYFKKKIDKADFTGMKIRVSPTSTAIVKALGGTPVSVPFADTYAALERGVVDGFAATYTGITEPGLHEVAKYALQHPFYSLNAPILVNGRKWDALPQQVKAELDRIALLYEAEVEKFNTSAVEAEDKLLKQKGMEFITLPEAEAKKFYDIALKVGWDDYLAKDTAGGEALKALATK